MSEVPLYRESCQEFSRVREKFVTTFQKVVAVGAAQWNRKVERIHRQPFWGYSPVHDDRNEFSHALWLSAPG